MDIYNFPQMYEVAFRTIPPLSLWRREWEREVYRFLVSLPFPPSSLLDACCGTGFLSTLIKEVYPNTKIVGIDKSESMIKFASAHFPSAEFRCEDFSSLTENFDVVIIGGGLTTIPIGDTVEVIERIAPLSFILSGYKSSIWSLSHRLFTRVVMGERCYIYTPSQIKEIFASRGINIKIRQIDVIEGSYAVYKL
ncbi:hypothetical protein CH333_07510 [candidate division WOR-3 bacterium JGI_Cruoil_03_44_89]|uniref:Methyltransferase domain-containing protein n=1 Tax=candidate division WOR-3 bacterium JGI_Cruoil_03_44_89 TaxID=1973748 RepID=A0A235BRL2_UNCW3|nr:MAG: hypothetical protein CH333_07510 [candidate division WOR-3 bacterium JGI_Cruoil_03_44_89]